MNSLIVLINNLTNKLQDLSLLTVRGILAYGFYEPAMNKWSDISSVAQWFGSMEIPMPLLNAYMAAGTETLGIILLTLGLFTRIISFPLIIIMIVAIVTVHLGNGFSAGDNGFEIPLYYIIFLFTLLTHGAGKLSLDGLMFNKNNS